VARILVATHHHVQTGPVALPVSFPAVYDALSGVKREANCPSPSGVDSNIRGALPLRHLYVVFASGGRFLLA
jgi:hypothetical protein